MEFSLKWVNMTHERQRKDIVDYAEIARSANFVRGIIERALTKFINNKKIAEILAKEIFEECMEIYKIAMKDFTSQKRG